MTTLNPLSVGDIGAVIDATITDDDGAVDITGATITLLLKLEDVYIEREADIVSAEDGTVTYTTVAGDLPTDGLWSLQWRAAWEGGNTLFYPAVPHVLPVMENLVEPV